ncbi:hypothetical protein COOONC_02311 [Cooperia oncophora]
MDREIEQSFADKMNVAERMSTLMALAKPQKVSNTVPIVRYYRSMIEAHRMALSYMKNQDLERALILLVRFCSFTIEELPKHPDFGSFGGEEKKAVFALLKPALERAENLKKVLKARFEAEAEEASKFYAAHQAELDARRYQKDHVVDRPTTVGAEANAVDIV